MSDIVRVNVPSVVAETIDGEAVIMNLKSGHYFSTADVGGEIWNWIEQGWGRGAMLEALAARYDATRETIAHALARFLDELTTHGLVVADEQTRQVAGPMPPTANGPRRAFLPPILNVYTDMKDLLLLDPIHDVDEVGWPTQKSPGTQV